ncbi:MAG: aminotransferase class V-fold PLP-dependent enzyme [Chloroflexota bacterium]
MNSGPTEVDRVRSLREVLTATGAGIYLSTHVAGPIPAETMTAVHESDDLELRIGRVGLDRDDDIEQREKEARAVAAAAIKASPEQVLLAHGVAQAAAISSLELLTQRAATDDGDGDGRRSRVLVLKSVAAPVLAAIRAVASGSGARVDIIDAAPQILAGDVALVVMPHVDALGNIADVARAGEAARSAGARLMVDASLSVGALSVEVDSLGADVLIADTHRWLLGPDAMTLVWLSGGLGEDVPTRLRATVGPFGRATLLAVSRSIGWLLMYIELPLVLTRTAELAGRLYDSLSAIEGVELLAEGVEQVGSSVHAAPDRVPPLAAFRINDWNAIQAAEELSRSVFAIVEADAERDIVRASVGAWNREDEIDRFIGRLTELAEHTPETLPRKPSLTVISGPATTEDEG